MYISAPVIGSNQVSLSVLTLSGVTTSGSNRNIALAIGGHMTAAPTVNSVVRGADTYAEVRADVAKTGDVFVRNFFWNSTNEPVTASTDLTVTLSQAFLNWHVMALVTENCNQTTRYQNIALATDQDGGVVDDTTVNCTTGNLVVSALWALSISGNPLPTNSATRRSRVQSVVWSEGAISTLDAVSPSVSMGWTNVGVNYVGCLMWEHPLDMPATEPEGTIDSPPGPVQILQGDQVNLLSSVTGGTAPYTHSWTFEAGSGVSELTTADPGATTFDQDGVWTVTYRATDDLSVVDPSPPTVEITVLNVDPVGVIVSPPGPVQIYEGDQVVFIGSASGGTGVYTYAWTFQAGSGVAMQTAMSPMGVQFDTPGTWTVTFTVTDDGLTVDPVPPTVIVTVLSLSVPGVAGSAALWLRRRRFYGYIDRH